MYFGAMDLFITIFWKKIKFEQILAKYWTFVVINTINRAAWAVTTSAGSRGTTAPLGWATSPAKA